ncbi:MAG TPA: hypothetical protein EYH03_00985 [Chromatiales bacterium]|nr:hypothetical protein [Chromatiales bacterium]
MGRVKSYLNAAAYRFDALTLRERALVILAVVVMVYILWDNLVWRAIQQREERITGETALLQKEMQRMALEIKELGQRFGIDPDADTRQQLADLEKEISGLKARARRAAEVLIEPDRMAGLMEKVLVEQKGLKLIGLETLESRPLLPLGKEGKDTPADTNNTGAEAETPLLFAHHFTVEFEGDYHSTLAYLKALEALPWRLLWDGIDYEVKAYPKARVRIELHTIGLSEGWIGA